MKLVKKTNRSGVVYYTMEPVVGCLHVTIEQMGTSHDGWIGRVYSPLNIINEISTDNMSDCIIHLVRYLEDIISSADSLIMGLNHDIG